MPSVNIKALYQRKFHALARNKDGSFASGQLLINDKPTKVPCSYYVEWYENGKRAQKAAGTVWRVALDTAKSQEKVLELRAAGIKAEIPDLADDGPTVGSAIESYLHKPNLRPKSYAKYTRDLEDFRQFMGTHPASTITETHINKFITHLQEQGYADATIRDKARAAVSAMREHGAQLNPKKIHAPRLTERIPEIYDLAVLDRLFAAADTDERDLFKTFLLTGFREAEVSHLEWVNVDFRHEGVAVRRKLGFEVKDYEERIVPLFPELAQILRERKKRVPLGRLIFGTQASARFKGGKPDKHMLRRLQRLAFRAGLNCGECVAKRKGSKLACETAAMCRQFGLHKFRKTYATMLLRDGFDLITMQKLLGHSDIETTRKYLKGFVAHELTEKIAKSTLAQPLGIKKG